jgi:group II intron reverse transcriptase/maturase
VIDLDIKGFFDNIRHDLLMRAVRHHTNCKWTLLYIERWLKAPVQNEDGSVSKRERGIPQGGAMSPLLANIFLHHVFDDWMARKYPDIKFERFADDIIVHCWKLGQAKHLLYEIRCRMYECGLILHSEKTKIVFCEDDKRNWGEGYPTSFDFLGFTFRKRTARGRNGTLYNGFQPAMSMDARRKISKTIRSWHIGRRGDLSLEEMSKDLNPTIRGWVNYYGKYYKSAFTPIRKQFHVALTRWAMRKYKKLNDRPKVASEWIYQIARREPHLFAFWEAFYESKG